MKLNQSALERCQRMIDAATALRIASLRDETGVRVVDCGVHVPGSLGAGLGLAEVCLAGLGRVQLTSGDRDVWSGPAVAVQTDQPVLACMASQYAGWQIAGKDFFGMGSGPMRAARGREELFEAIGFRERPTAAVGVVESGKLPREDVCHHVAVECGVDPNLLTLLVAPTASLAGTVQVVARTVETALHKMHEIGLDIGRVVSGYGVAPLPPVAATDLQGIGRTNDAVLYGGETTLWLTGDDDDRLAELGAKIPSSASPDHGQPFSAIFDRYDRDFYKIDPLLFSPAKVTLVNVQTGRSFCFGQTRSDVLRKSFAS